MKIEILIALLDWVRANLAREICPFRLVATAHFSPPTPTPTVKGALPMALTLQVTQQFPIEIQPVDARGNPAAVDGAPVWSVSDETLLKVEAADDGLSAVVSALGPVGSAQVTVRADARMGPEVREIVGTLDVSLIAAEAATLRLVPGVPTEIEAGPQPEPAPTPTPEPTPIPEPQPEPTPNDPNLPPPPVNTPL